MNRYDAFFIKLQIIVPTGSIVSGALPANSAAATSKVFYLTTTKGAGVSFPSFSLSTVASC
jgi:hypothetical protein